MLLEMKYNVDNIGITRNTLDFSLATVSHCVRHVIMKMNGSLFTLCSFNSGCTLRVPSRMKCSPPLSQRSSALTWPMLCCCSSHWECKTFCSSTSWIHHLKTTCWTPCTSCGSWELLTTQVRPLSLRHWISIGPQKSLLF